MRSTGLALMTTALALASACGSPTTPDGGTTDATVRADAAPRPDAAANADAAPNADAEANADAEPSADAGVAPDADAPADAEPAMDVGPADTGDPCAPVPRAQGLDRLTTSLTAWLARCNPELTANEALAVAGAISRTTQPVFEDLTIPYDDVSAGACGCAIEAAPCDNLARFRAVPACDRTFASTATTGDDCTDDFQCPIGHVCNQRPSATALGGGFSCGPGACMRLVDLGQPCDLSDVVCRPGTYCDFNKSGSLCTASATVGEDCSNRPCLGDDDDVMVFPPNECVFTKADTTCRPRGRGPTGDCFGRRCHDLYACQPDYSCTLEPGDGQACPTPYDLAMPPPNEQSELISSAAFTCRIPFVHQLGAGFWCTQTGTTTGRAECRPAPSLGQACGIGQGLAAACSGDAYCAGIDEYTLAPVTGTCVPRLTRDSTCTPSLFEANDPCEAGSYCYTDGESQPTCAIWCGPPVLSGAN